VDPRIPRGSNVNSNGPWPSDGGSATVSLMFADLVNPSRRRGTFAL
jgi:hypothetical protein